MILARYSNDDSDISIPDFYTNRHNRLIHAVMMYQMRPKLHHNQKSEEIVNHVIPSNFHDNRAAGFLIRGSDKCGDESTCVNFDDYMERANQAGNSETDPYIILTTEDRKIFDSLEEFEKKGETNLKFFVNREDVMQGSGVREGMGDASMEAVHFSSIVAIKLQLHSTLTFGNCCSNWHNVVFDFINSGCSYHAEGYSLCFQEDSNPKFHMCCNWPTVKECDAFVDDVGQSEGGDNVDTSKANEDNDTADSGMTQNGGGDGISNEEKEGTPPLNNDHEGNQDEHSNVEESNTKLDSSGGDGDSPQEDKSRVVLIESNNTNEGVQSVDT